ncbi:hypothetical protein [Xenorhabdus lircayensis]|uniref:Uncharacterized protein n=1 Tax=Xenorhabdus lircayensis TaxID=2763499 RepID=A0ABS0U1Q5_9GAMM|nr:hypothetical protein [Xenorhabdus lircayensis]MBI6547537.1 hypothetical protein [Xenorhabdus lircayensis]
MTLRVNLSPFHYRMAFAFSTFSSTTFLTVRLPLRAAIRAYRVPLE